FDGGLGLNTRWLGWGAGFADFDNDGWLDIFLTNGHVYPEVRQLRTEAGYEQRKVVYRNVGGRFEDVTERLGPPATSAKAGRGTAFGDIDNNGTVDVAINNVHDTPDLFLTSAPAANHWLLLRLIGTRSNRSAIGARVTLRIGPVVQVQEVRGGGSYISQNDLRVHFGLGAASRADRLEVRWPNGLEEMWQGISADHLITFTEGTGTPMPERP
ncbi:MAG TPA: CRTAC1 family protein, partial [Vicinamibacterales bacterium]|nr:CRTAC1 family protein [Vicinamibacterales bacterium]